MERINLTNKQAGCMQYDPVEGCLKRLAAFNGCLKTIMSVLVFFLLLCAPRTTANGASEFNQVTIVVPQGLEYVVTDRLDGVEAKYREGGAWTDETGKYSCAGFVTAYYQAIYGIFVNNLIDSGPPQPSDKLVRVDVPQKGDIIFYPSPPNKNNHSAIVKSFDGSRITLIEQNYKWVSDGVTYAAVDRIIGYPDPSYQIYRAAGVAASIPPESSYDSSYSPIALSDFDLLSMLSFEFFTDIQIPDGQSPTLVSSDIYDTASFISERPYSFTIPAGFEMCLYYESMGNPANYKLAYPGENVTAVSAIFKRPAATIPAFAQADPIPSYRTEAVVQIGGMSMSVNGVSFDIDSPAYIENGRTMMPVKWLSAALGIDETRIRWNGAERTVTVEADKTIRFTVGSSILSLDNEQIIMDAPSVIRYDRAYLPVRYLADALGIDFEWNGEEKTLTFLLEH